MRFAPHKKGYNHSVEESSIPRKHLSELSEKIAKRNFFLGSSFEKKKLKHSNEGSVIDNKRRHMHATERPTNINNNEKDT